MNIITYLKSVPAMKRFFGIAVTLAGLTVLLSGQLIFGAIFFVIGINIVSTEGSQINLDAKTYRTIKSIFGLHIGKWKPCPEFEYISVFRTKESQAVTVVTASTTFTSEVILINLFYNKNKHQTFYKTDNNEDAFKVAQHFKLAFDIDVLDATEKEHRWL